MPKQINLNNGVTLTIEDTPFTGGGEGDLHRIISPPSYKEQVAKLYKAEKRTKERERKIAYLVANPPIGQSSNGHQAIIWPTNVAYQGNQFVGLTMPIAKGEKLELLCHPKLPAILGQSWHRFSLQDPKSTELRLKICFNIGVALHQIHNIGRYVLIDMKPDNIMIQPNGLISIIDIDSLEVIQQGKLLFPAPVATPEYTPSEYYKGLNLEKDGIPDTWDRFSLAVIFYRLLCGIHPFTGSCNAPFNTCTELPKMIENGLFPHSSTMGRHFQVIPPPHQNFPKLPHPLRELFIRCFESGHVTPHQRPSANDWCQTLSPRPDIQINRVLPSQVVKNTNSNLPAKLHLTRLEVPLIPTITFITTPQTTKLRTFIYGILGDSKLEKQKKQVLLYHNKVKELVKSTETAIKTFQHINKAFSKVQTELINKCINDYKDINQNFSSKLVNIDAKSKILHEEEIKEVYIQHSNLTKSVKRNEERIEKFYIDSIKVIEQRTNNEINTIQKKINDLKVQELAETKNQEIIVNNLLNDLEKQNELMKQQHIDRIDREEQIQLEEIQVKRTIIQQQEHTERNRTLELNQEKHIRSSLCVFTIEEHARSIFTDGYVDHYMIIKNLHQYNIKSAADVIGVNDSGAIKMKDGNWVKVPHVGIHRAKCLGEWSTRLQAASAAIIPNKLSSSDDTKIREKYFMAYNELITKQQKTNLVAHNKKLQIPNLMAQHIAETNVRKEAFIRQYQQNCSVIRTKHSGQIQESTQMLQKVQSKSNKMLAPIKQEFERLKTESINQNAKYKASYEKQLKLITHKFDDLHILIKQQALTCVKEAETKMQFINTDTHTKLTNNLNEYTRRHQEFHGLAVVQANLLREAVTELEELQQAYLSST